MQTKTYVLLLLHYFISTIWGQEKDTHVKWLAWLSITLKPYLIHKAVD